MNTKTLYSIITTALIIVQALASFFGIQPMQAQSVVQEREAMESATTTLIEVVRSCKEWKE